MEAQEAERVRALNESMESHTPNSKVIRFADSTKSSGMTGTGFMKKN